MGLFDRFKKDAGRSEQEEAYEAQPHLYQGEDGEPFGSFALTEETPTAFPMDPRSAYRVDGQPVPVWRMVLVSTTEDTIIGDMDYYDALAAMADYLVEARGDVVVFRGLSLEEMRALGA